jgi:hypothetical protein
MLKFGFHCLIEGAKVALRRHRARNVPIIGRHPPISSGNAKLLQVRELRLAPRFLDISWYRTRAAT